MAKYIIDVKDGETLYKAVIAPDGEPYITPAMGNVYTEPDLEQVRKEAYEDGYKTAKVQCNIQAEKDLREVGERHYQKGLEDAWEYARKIIHMPEADLLNLFTECYSAVCTSVQVFLKYDASECIEKIRQYEQGKEEIQVGDEVATDAGNRASVLYENPDGTQAFVFKSDGTAAWWTKSALHRTGRHFPEIAEALKKMRESE